MWILGQLHPNDEKEIAHMGAAGMGLQLVFEGTLAFLLSNPQDCVGLC